LLESKDAFIFSPEQTQILEELEVRRWSAGNPLEIA
jgi:hypothetical protein